jgi:hypothetical protein
MLTPGAFIGVEMARIGHESLSILLRFAHNLLSVLDPSSLVSDIAAALTQFLKSDNDYKGEAHFLTERFQ